MTEPRLQDPVDPKIYAPEAPALPCTCGDDEDEHAATEPWACEVEGCDCDRFTERDPEPEDFEPDEPDYDSMPGGADDDDRY